MRDALEIVCLAIISLAAYNLWGAWASAILVASVVLIVLLLARVLHDR